MNSSHIQLLRWLFIVHKRAPTRDTGFTTRPLKYILASFLLNSVPSRFLMSYSSQELLPWTDLCPLLVRMLFLASSKGTIPPGLAWPGLALRVQCTVNSDVIFTDTNTRTHTTCYVQPQIHPPAYPHSSGERQGPLKEFRKEGLPFYSLSLDSRSDLPLFTHECGTTTEHRPICGPVGYQKNKSHIF